MDQIDRTCHGQARELYTRVIHEICGEGFANDLLPGRDASFYVALQEAWMAKLAEHMALPALHVDEPATALDEPGATNAVEEEAKEAPVQDAEEACALEPVAATTDEPIEAPAVIPNEAPAEAAAVVPDESPADEPMDASANEPSQAPVDASPEPPVGQPVEGPEAAPMQATACDVSSESDDSDVPASRPPSPVVPHRLPIMRPPVNLFNIGRPAAYMRNPLADKPPVPIILPTPPRRKEKTVKEPAKKRRRATKMPKATTEASGPSAAPETTDPDVEPVTPATDATPATERPSDAPSTSDSAPSASDTTHAFAASGAELVPLAPINFACGTWLGIYTSMAQRGRRTEGIYQLVLKATLLRLYVQVTPRLLVQHAYIRDGTDVVRVVVERQSDDNLVIQLPTGATETLAYGRVCIAVDYFSPRGEAKLQLPQ
ncbi:hypothetical protein SPRG_15537 [Saprolegnia parasitica CBS 223.65]|uniref:Uncharacterized protein n=1 Tax=Saprolegnia parasitica (strain CBS 223.65) TaxID=695850 RepID=A0A067BM52_SAPPC|nr:hypothetical protein SPRG_15537 [Saprolegnia parasitica CBS 223.65]KDO19268.1 hypothetical protein SPRG_15537 [Saprolegnia parasitica CBS 223.65]|eukprot:XP_012210011.1 hypothetical protein SPRG_15537 [Saprolegnia parasitica CBS 223.65]